MILPSVCIHFSFFEDCFNFTLANNADPDEMLQSAAFHLGLQCLPKNPFPVYKVFIITLKKRISVKLHVLLDFLIGLPWDSDFSFLQNNNILIGNTRDVFYVRREVDLMKTAKVNAYIMHIFGKIELSSIHAT